MAITINSDSNSRISVNSNQEIDLITNNSPRFRVESTGQIKAVYESTIGTDYNTQLDNGYLCRAWVNFDGSLSQTTGTYTRSGFTITCSISSHGLTTGQTANLSFTTGGATSGIYVVTVIDSGSFTVQDTVSGTITSSSVTMLSRLIRGSGNISSITKSGTGNYAITFLNPMLDTSYSVLAHDYSWGLGFSDSITTSGFRSLRYNNSFNYQDVSIIFIAVFR